MTIYKDGIEKEKVTLSDYDDRSLLHALFAEKGFEKYSDEELAEQRQTKQELEEEIDEERHNRLRGNINQLTKPMTGGKISKKMLSLLADEKLSPAQQKVELIQKIKGLKVARDNYMMVGMPDDRKQSEQ